MVDALSNSYDGLTPPVEEHSREQQLKKEFAYTLAAAVGLVALTVIGFGVFCAGVGLMATGLAVIPLTVLIFPGMVCFIGSPIVICPAIGAAAMIFKLFQLYQEIQKSKVDQSEATI